MTSLAPSSAEFVGQNRGGWHAQAPRRGHVCPSAESVARAGIPTLPLGLPHGRSGMPHPCTCHRARRQPTTHRSPHKLFCERLKMPEALKKQQHLATPRKRLTHARKRLTAGQTPRFCAFSSPLPGHRFHRVFRFHPTPTRQTVDSESATRVTPPKKIHLKNKPIRKCHCNAAI